MADKIKLRRDTQDNWEAVNPILDEGELGVILDSNGLVIGNGTTEFTKLPQRRTFSEDIDITVGPGGDFDNPDDALDYIQYLQPKHFHFTHYLSTETRGMLLYQNPQINLIFKTGYVFENPFVIENKFMPWLNITQEDLNTPLIVTLSNQPSDTSYATPAMTINSSRIRSFSLNLLNQSALISSGIVIAGGSQVQYVPYIKLEHFSSALYTQGASAIYVLKEFHFNDMTEYGFYSADPGSTMYISSTTGSMNNIGNSAFCAIEAGHIHIYQGSLTFDNCDSIFFPTRFGTEYIHIGTSINVSNASSIVKISWGGMFHTDSPITKGINVTNEIDPSDLIINTFDSRGWVRAPYGLTN